MAIVECNINGPDEQTVGIAKRLEKAKEGDQISVADVKRLARGVIQFEAATTRLQAYVDQMRAAQERLGQ